jgi:LL-diaminopimelate aminotransferase
MYGDDGRLPKAIADNMAVYAERRKVLVDGLRELGYDVVMPKGTFYVWFDCKTSSAEFTQKMIDIGVIVTPGSGFGESAEGYVRMTVTQPVPRIKEALDRMKNLKL